LTKKKDPAKRTGATTRRRPKGTGSQYVYAALRKRILSLALAPGANLEEASLVKDFGVSRTPVREALIRLASEGLIDFSPNRGGQVAALQYSDIPQYFEGLDLLQRATTRWAAARRSSADLRRIRQAEETFARAARKGDSLAMIEANHRFHAAIAEASGNAHITRAYLRLLDEGLRLARMSFEYDPRQPLDEHTGLAKLIAAQDADRAEALAHQHAERFRSRIIRFLDRNLASEVSIEAPSEADQE